MNRRQLLKTLGAAAGAAFTPFARSQPSSVSFDFRGKIPKGVQFVRNGAAVVAEAGILRSCASDEPRFPRDKEGPRGLLVEGTATNFARNSSALNRTGWSTSGSISTAWAADQPAPDGSRGVFSIRRGVPLPNSLCANTVAAGTDGEYAVASVWLRSAEGTGKWRLRLFDFHTYNGSSAVVEVSPDWRRFELPMPFGFADIGPRKFAVADNSLVIGGKSEPDHRWNDPSAHAGDGPDLPLVYAWGAQYEQGNQASSWIASSDEPGMREEDKVLLPLDALDAAQGTLSLHLPDGGRRGAILFDADGEADGIRLEYSNSGWLKARVGGRELSGCTETTEKKVVQLSWNGTTVQLRAGDDLERLEVQASLMASQTRPRCGGFARLGMGPAGQRPLNQVFSLVTIDRHAALSSSSRAASFVPAGYSLVFGDEFDDTDVSRINENATGGKPGAPAWRSRYRQERSQVINHEKQIYMDPAFRGTADHPLGVQPFSIRDGILRIQANRADPTAVSPFVWGYKYTSGCITTELTHWQTYGYFEMKARCPRGKGFWPAFWLLPKRDTWPPEIDVFEISGTRPFGIHSGVIEKKGAAKGYWTDQAVDVSDGFHVYGMEWTESNIVCFVDEKKYFEYGPHPLHEDMYVLVNLALGSVDPNWIPDPDRSTPFPGELEIDYIRVYSRTART